MRDTRKSPSHPLTILLIEDHSGDARLLTEYLSESTLEAHLRHETTLEAGLERLSNETPDVVAVDLALPDSEGPETVKAVASAAPTTPIVVLTGRGDLEAALEAQEAGATEYLQKGELSPTLVGRTIQWAVQRVHMRQKLRQRDAWIRSISENVAGGLFRVGSTGRIEYANPALVGLLGFEREEELIGKDLTTFFVDPEKRGHMLAEEGADDVELELERQDGSTFVGLLSANAVYGAEGQARRYDGMITDITERAERKRKLRRQKNLLKQTQRLAGGWMADVRSGDVSWSEKVYEIFEVPKDASITTEGVMDFHDAGARATLKKAYERVVEAGEPYDLELPLTTAEGTDRWVRAVGAPAKIEDGEVVTVAGAVQNITDRKEAERSLRESEEFHRETLRQISDAVLLTAEDGSFTYVCPNVEHIFGWTAEEVRDLGSISALLGSDPARDTNFAGAREVSNIECSIRGREGERHDLLVNVRRVSIGDGRRMYTCRDITERKTAKRERERLAKAMDVASDGMALLDEGGTYTYVNQAHVDIFGYDDPEDFLGSTWRICYADAQIERLEEEIMPTLFEERTWRGEILGQRKDGTRFPQQVTLTRLEDGGIICVTQDISDRKRKERRRTQIVDRVTEGIVEVDQDWRFTLVNDEAERLYGTDEEALLSRSFWNVFEEVEGTRFERVYRQVMQTREPERIEAYYSGLGGWFNVQVYPNEDGGVAFYFKDVTERRRREEQIERQNDLFSKAQDLAQVGGWEYEVASGELTWTHQVYDIYGLSSESFAPSPDNVFDYFHPDDRATIEEAFAQSVDEGKEYEVEVRLNAEGGDTKWVRAQGKPELAEDGTVLNVRGAFQDITEQKEHERELRRTERLLRKTLESLNEAIIVVDPSSREVVECNSAVRDIFGYEPDELIGQSTEMLHRNRDAYERFASLGEPRLEENGHFATEYQMRRKDGEIIDTENVVTPLKGDQWPDGVVSVIRDITERKMRERQLREAKEEAEEASRLKSTMLVNMSHEIRTPLTTIIGFAEAIRDEVRKALDDEETDLSTLAEFSELIEKGARRLMDTLTRILNLSRLEAGEMELSPEPIDLGCETEMTVEQFFPQAEKAGIELSVQKEDHPYAHVDQEGVRIILRNLVSNAIKYPEEEGWVEVRVRVEGERAVLEVEDNGIGMSPDDTDRLFEAFKQASEGMARTYEGTGVGLTITHKMVSRMDGSIQVTTEKGEGSCFSVRFPLAEG